MQKVILTLWSTFVCCVLSRWLKKISKNATYCYQWIETTMSVLTWKEIVQDHQSRKTLYYNQLICFQKSLEWFCIHRVLLIVTFQLPGVCYRAQQVLVHCSWRQAVLAALLVIINFDATKGSKKHFLADKWTFSLASINWVHLLYTF